MAIAQNRFLVPPQSRPFRPVLAMLSERVLESRRRSEASWDLTPAKSRADFVLDGRNRFSALRRNSKPQRIGRVAKCIPRSMVCVGGLIFHRVLRVGFCGRKAKGVDIPPVLAH